MSEAKLFKAEFDDIAKDTKTHERINKRRVINGMDDGLMQVSPLKHPWGYELFKAMLNNTWMPQEVQMAKDVEMWNSGTAVLTPREREVYYRTLAFASNLDGLLVYNLGLNIIRQITSPEIVLAVVRQAYEEALHVHSYATMIEAMGMDPDAIYGLYLRDRGLYEKNKTVLAAARKIGDPTFKTGTFENNQLFLDACVANMIMEGVYFYSAFLIFYVFRRSNKMPGSAEMIQFINRDEDLHVKLFINIVNEIKKENPELWTDEFKSRVTQNIKDGVEMEIKWAQSCIGDGILGLNPENIKQYIQFIGDHRLAAIGLPRLWNSENPFPWIEEFTQSSMIEVNFFEGTVREYSVGALDWDK